MPSPALSPASSLALARSRPASAAPEALGGGAVWRADELARNVGATRPTGHAALDAVLPGGGWPVGALVEVLQPQAGHGPRPGKKQETRRGMAWRKPATGLGNEG